MIPFQVRLEAALASATQVATFMHRTWSWPIAESIHFMGLSLLFGSIAAWDLRLMGVAKPVPIAAFHRLIPFAILGFAINATSGMFFLMADANQYVYSPSATSHPGTACGRRTGASFLRKRPIRFC